MKMTPFERRIVNAPWFNQLLARFYFPGRFERIDRSIKGRVLEIGCGAGWTTHLLLQHLTSSPITAIDFDERQVEAARQRFASLGPAAGRVRFLQGDATQLSLPDGSFEAAFEFHVFHHIKGFVAAIREAFRVLKPGGHFYALDLGRAFFGPLVRRFFPPEITFTRGEFAGQMRAAGFKIEGEFGGEKLFMIHGVKPTL